MLGMWLSLILVSMSWLFSLHIYTQINYYWTFILIGIAVILSSFCFRKVKLEVSDNRYLFFCIPLLIACVILPFPYNLGPSILILSLLLFPFSKFFPLVFSLWIVGLLLIIQAPIPHLYMCFTAKFQQCDILTPLVYQILKFLGLPVSLSQHTIFIETMRELYEFPTTWDKLAIFPLLNLLIGGVILLKFFFRGQTLNIEFSPKFHIQGLTPIVVLFALTTIIYLIVRYIFMILIFLYLMYFVPYDEEASNVFLFWNPIIIMCSFIPYIFLLKFFNLQISPGIVHAQFNPLFFDKSRIRSIVFISLATFFIIGYFGFHDPGSHKEGRILIDEAHSDFEKTTQKYDTNWYGQESGYNYYCMADYLNYYYKLDRNFGTITSKLLSNYDILILKIPTSIFLNDEIEAIVEFVKAGGGLFLLGEHTNVFGSSAYLNPIAKRFGFYFRYDCLFDIEKKFEQLYRPPTILPHPIVQNMPCFLFATSCSIEPKYLLGENVILSSGLKSLDIDYSSSNFYPQVIDSSKMDFGSFIQAIGVRYGKGRVVGFTDSTCFSNFSAFIPGKPELLLGTMNWLNKENFLSWLNYLFLILGTILLVFGILNFRKKGGVLILITPVIFMTALGMLVFTIINKLNYPLPKPHTKPIQICFESKHSDFELPIEGFVEDNQRSFEIFYQWILRLSYFPIVREGVKKERSEVVVIINPKKEFTTKEVSKIKDYLALGGKVLLMDSPFNTNSTANSLLSTFGVKINHLQKLKSSSFYAQPFNNYYPLEVSSSPIEGGEPIFFATTGETIGSIIKEGKGSLVVLSFSDRFVDANMGVVESVIPDEELLSVYQLEFDIFEELVAGKL
ncbi:MAG: hypothetical protein AB1567_12745 [bacterium]